MDANKLEKVLKQKSEQSILGVESASDMLTLEVKLDCLVEFATLLQADKDLCFTTLLDVCGVDYSDYGVSYWRQEEQTSSGYNRAAVDAEDAAAATWQRERFVVVYHLLSMHLNTRLRLKVYVPASLMVDSVVAVWPSADWYEREAFDLFGVKFAGHPNLQRILTDYDFKGHPFRKDFPLIGEVEMRYDANQEACIYEPVSIQPRVLTPKVIRNDSRYCHIENEERNPHV